MFACLSVVIYEVVCPYVDPLDTGTQDVHGTVLAKR
jgi:hypothetical protein